jgi:hypothetical protein
MGHQEHPPQRPAPAVITSHPAIVAQAARVCQAPGLPPNWPSPSRRQRGDVSASPAGGSGWLIDTPGVRGFGLGHVTPDRLVEAFGDLAEGTADCPPGCDHLSPDCALDAWAAAHDAQPRLASLRRLLRSRESAD